MKALFITLAVALLAACSRDAAPATKVADSTTVKSSRYILISNVTSPGPGCTETSTSGVWSCPAP